MMVPHMCNTELRSDADNALAAHFVAVAVTNGRIVRHDIISVPHRPARSQIAWHARGPVPVSSILVQPSDVYKLPR